MAAKSPRLVYRQSSFRLVSSLYAAEPFLAANGDGHEERREPSRGDVKSLQLLPTARANPPLSGILWRRTAAVNRQADCKWTGGPAGSARMSPHGADTTAAAERSSSRSGRADA